MTATVGHKYRSEQFRQLFAEGEAQAILTVLDVNGVDVPDDARQTILACTDLDQLGTWLRRAVRATSIDDVLTR